MKLLLTSGGISNKSIEDELKKLLNKDNFNGVKLLFCTTASNYEGYNMSDWLVDDLIYLKNNGFEIDICDINGISIDKLLPRFEWADVYFFEGGNTQWLKKGIEKSGLEAKLLNLLKRKVWIGVSAGSTVVCPTISDPVNDLYDEDIEGYPKEGLNFVDFQVMPHLNNSCFPKINIENIMNASKKINEIDRKRIFVLDDNSAVVVNGNEIKVVSEGTWYEI